MSKKELVSNRQYTDEFKVEAVRLAESIGGNKAADGSTVPVKRSLAEAEAVNARLRRELTSTKLDLEIVKKAAAYFASRGEVRLDQGAKRPVQRSTDAPSA